MIAFDTNVLIYALDNRYPPRQAVAAGVLTQAIAAGQAFVSLQVLSEFYHTATRKLALAPVDTAALIGRWRQVMRVQPYDETDLAAAMAAHAAHGLTFWDALIWAVCERAGVPRLASEDFQDGRTLGRVTFLNPFNPASAARLAV